jgi:hypothetical protein
MFSLYEGDLMQKTASTHSKQGKAVEAKISHLSLPGLLPPGQTLVLNLETRTMSLLTDGPILLMEQQFSVNELRMIVPLLESYPYYCPYEVLLAYISANFVTEATIAHCRQRLQEALSRGTWQQELRPIRRALSSLRSKLEHFNLAISNIRERGCSLTNLTPHSPPLEV